jgi:hypothetical protein
MVNDTLIESYKLLDLDYNVTEVAYTGEYLYNIMFYTSDLIEINNIVMETLHSSNYSILTSKYI